MKKIFVVLLLSMAVSSLFAEKSIEDVMRSFNEKLARNGIPKAEVVIGSIHFGETETHGSVAGWMKDEITKAAVKMRRINVIRDTLKAVKAEVKTRGMVDGQKKPQSALKKKYIISGKYIENKAKGVVSLTLYLEISEGDTTEIFAAETAIIQSSELEDRELTLFPENIEQVKNIEQDCKTAVSLEKKTNSSKQSEDKETSFSNVSQTKNERQERQKEASIKEKIVQEMPQAVQITAFMLDKKNNLVDTLHPGDTVNFLVSTNKDAYIKIMGIDAKGSTFWLPIKDNFIKANIVRTFPDDNTIDYQVVDGVFGAEHLLIYAATSKEGLPAETKEEQYYPGLITNTTRGIEGVKKNENFTTGVFKISYTVLP